MFLKTSKISQDNTWAGVFFNKGANLKACNFIKKRLQHRRFPVKFPNILKTSFLKEYLKWQLLYVAIRFHRPKLNIHDTFYMCIA